MARMVGHWRHGLVGLGLLAFGMSVEAADEPGTEPVILPPELVNLVAWQAMVAPPERRSVALRLLARRGNTDVVPALIQSLRHTRNDSAVLATLNQLVGDTDNASWAQWMLWLEDHPEVKPFPGFDGFKADALSLLDENFRLFIHRGVAHEIRLEEIVWGGVIKDGIPALVQPTHVAAADADYLGDDETVFGVAINGDARAYPLRIMDWHEMANDVVGGVPVALAYCTLCGSGILYETAVAGRAAPFVFGSSGMLYRSNKLMYDHETNSLWNQFTGRPVVGTLTGSGIALDVRPVVITTWAKWRERHPGTRVLDLDTGYVRDYSPGRPYGAYFASPNLMFPARVTDSRLEAKDQVYVVRVRGQEKAWPLNLFEGGAIINDRVGDTAVTLVGEASTRTVRAYESSGQSFMRTPQASQLKSGDGSLWRVTEDALESLSGARLPRLPGHIAYWFAWQNFMPDAPETLSAP